jgi:hypothetical protein
VLLLMLLVTLADITHDFPIWACHLIGIGDGFGFPRASKGSLCAYHTDRKRENSSDDRWHVNLSKNAP